MAGIGNDDVSLKADSALPDWLLIDLCCSCWWQSIREWRNNWEKKRTTHDNTKLHKFCVEKNNFENRNETRSIKKNWLNISLARAFFYFFFFKVDARSAVVVVCVMRTDGEMPLPADVQRAFISARSRPKNSKVCVYTAKLCMCHVIISVRVRAGCAHLSCALHSSSLQCRVIWSRLEPLFFLTIQPKNKRKKEVFCCNVQLQLIIFVSSYPEGDQSCFFSFLGYYKQESWADWKRSNLLLLRLGRLTLLCAVA